MKYQVIRLLRPFLATMLAALVGLSCMRIALLVWQSERVNSLQTGFGILAQGLRVDIATLSYLLLLPVLIHLLLPNQKRVRAIWQKLLCVYLSVILVLLACMELVTPTFIAEYDLRPNRLFVEYLLYPKEVFGMLWTGYKASIFVVVIGTIGTAWLAFRLVGQQVSAASEMGYLPRMVTLLVVVLALFIGARSTFGHRPLNPAMVAFSDDILLNELALNSSFSLAFAMKSIGAEKSAAKFYGDMPVAEMLAVVKAQTGREQSFIAGAIPTMNRQLPSYQGKPRNLVILLQESLGARFVGGLGGLPLTPNLDKLMQQGWAFEQLFATGTRSVRGIEAVTTGFLPTPSRAVVKLSKAQHGFFTIAELLQQAGYHTQFVYGGESHFDNMKSFFLGNGFSDIVDLPKFAKTSFVGSWGASDQDLYAEAHRQFEQLNKQDKPFFSLVFTSSNHTPYEFPAGEIEPYEQPLATRNNAIKYSDKALGEFFAKAQASDYWHNTVFLVIADHDARVDSTTPVPVKNFHIPGLILGEGITPQKDQRIASNLDMPATMLSLIGVENVSPMLGFDLTKPHTAAPRAMMQFSNNFGYLTAAGLTVLQPDKAPSAYIYRGVNAPLEATNATPLQVQIAKAHALLGNYLYSQGLYKLPERP
ncbi:LTA synthase family protein [Pseudoalteromonas fenneropenaei]|uniref:LTA synthase family protein n=1 Tax=Pseudoalteromonas fenneropenaei TaxID=1737459 RepID=A0ABV7CQB5_9GAMM